MTKTFDPFAIERPRIKLGAHGEWELGELHDARYEQVQAWCKTFESVAGDENATIGEVARTVGELVEVACISATGIPDLLSDLCDVKKHGENACGLHTLRAIVSFLVEWATGEASAGEG